MKLVIFNYDNYRFITRYIIVMNIMYFMENSVDFSMNRFFNTYFEVVVVIFPGVEMNLAFLVCILGLPKSYQK